MTAEPTAAGPGSAGPLATPREVRDLLLPEEVGQFDSEWRAALARAAEALDLADVHAVLDRWRLVARLTQADPDAHRRMVQKADRPAGGPAPSVPVEEIRERIRRTLTCRPA